MDIKVLRRTNLLVAVGSVDGMAAATAFKHQVNPQAAVYFTQAFEVDKLKPSEWPAGSQVGFLDLAVDRANHERTENFVAAVRQAGHQLLFVCDEHHAGDWRHVLGDTFDDLLIKPETHTSGGASSSSALLLRELGGLADDHTQDLLFAGDRADALDFRPYFAMVYNMAIKPAIFDNARREYLVGHFATSRVPDAQVIAWMVEYEPILATHDRLIAARVSLGDDMVRVDACGEKIDATALFMSLYKRARVVVLAQTIKDQTQISIGTGDRTLDLVGALDQAGMKAGGKGQKANLLDVNDEGAAIGVLRALVKRA